MLRVVERVFGEGELQGQTNGPLKAGYQLAVYRDWRDQDGTLTAGDFVVEGHVLASPDELRPLLFTEKDE